MAVDPPGDSTIANDGNDAMAVDDDSDVSSESDQKMSSAKTATPRPAFTLHHQRLQQHSVASPPIASFWNAAVPPKQLAASHHHKDAAAGQDAAAGHQNWQGTKNKEVAAATFRALVLTQSQP
jgi:hypothetical protein